MTLRIGRFVSTDAAASIVQDGDLISLGFNIAPATLAEAKAMRQQILGVVENPDEPVIPMTWSDDTDYDGFYRPIGATVEPTQAYLTNRLMRGTVAMERVENGYTNPILETYVVNRVATNGHSVTAPTHAIAYAYGESIASFEFDSSDLAGATTVLTPECGNYVTDEAETFTVGYDSGGDFEGYSRLLAHPSYHYSAPACRITVDGYEVMGRQPITGGGIWEITNGVVRVGSTDSQANSVAIGGYDADTPEWVTKLVRPGAISAGSFSTSGIQYTADGVQLVILRNSPETVTVRVSNGPSQPSFVYTIWRGGTIVQCVVATPTASTIALGLSPTAAGSNITGGVRTTSNDGNGNRFAILNRAAVTTSTTHTAAQPTSSTTRSVFALAWQIGGSTAAAPFTDAALLDQLCAPPQWQQRVVAR